MKRKTLSDKPGSGWDYIRAVANGEINIDAETTNSKTIISDEFTVHQIMQDQGENDAYNSKSSTGQTGSIKYGKYNPIWGKYGIVHETLFKQGFSSKSVALYCAMSIFADEFGRLFTGRDTLMKMSGIKSAHTFVESLEELEKANFIEVEHRKTASGKFTSSVYTLTPQPLQKDEPSPSAPTEHGEGTVSS